MEYIQYIKPELFVLIPVLLIVGKILKSSAVSNKHIPVILGVIGVALSCLWICGSDGDDLNLYNLLLTGFIQGILCAGGAVYGNQVFKQYTTKDKSKVKQNNDGGVQ